MKRVLPLQSTFEQSRLALVVALSAIVTLVLQSTPARAQDRPNIVFIVADDVGAESMDMYGGSSWPTPRINSIATEGMRFENAYACPYCAPSRGQFMTGRYQFRNGIVFPTLQNGSLSTINETTFSTILKQNGYATGIAGKWHLYNQDDGGQQAGHLEDHGFEEHSTFYSGAISYGSPSPEEDYTPFQYNQWACNFIRRKAQEPAPFYLQYSMGLVHWERDQNGNRQLAATPLNPEATTQNSTPQELYGPMMGYMDQMVGKVLDTIDETGIADNTVVIFAGDNGTWDIITSTWNGRRIAGGKGSSKDTGSWVPFYVRWPEVIQPGSTYRGMTDFSDLFPTILEIAGAVVPNYRLIDGISFLPQLLGNPTEHRQIAYSGQNYGYANAFEFVRDKQWKLIVDDGVYSLYDVRRSPLSETYISVSRQSSAQAEARNRLRAYYDQLHNAELTETGADSDHDGQTDFSEVIAGTDPTSAQSKFEIESLLITRDAGGLRCTLRFQTNSNRIYHILSSATLQEGSWTVLPDPVSGTGGEVEVTFPAAESRQHYRLSVEKVR